MEVSIQRWSLFAFSSNHHKSRPVFLKADLFPRQVQWLLRKYKLGKLQNWFELCAWINHFTLTAWAFGQSWKFMPWSQKLAVLKAFLPHRTFYWENFWTMIVDIICLEIIFGFIKIILTCISFELERNAFLCRERRRCTISWLHALTVWRHSYYLGYSHKLAVVTKFGFLWLPIVEKNVRTP